MDVYSLLEQQQAVIAEGDWDELERAGVAAAVEISGDRHLRKVIDVDLTDYTRALDHAIGDALSRVEKSDPAALYFEYDLDNGWESAIFLCSAFEPPFVPFAEWPIGSDEHVEGPALPAFAKAFGRFGWDNTEESRAMVIVTVARTTAAFGRALHRGDPQRDLPWAIGFHDQDPLTMIANPSRR